MKQPANEYAYDLCEKYKALCDTIFIPRFGHRKELEDCARQCALITIEELTNNIPWEDKKQSAEDYTYFMEVKEAINAL